MRNDDTASRVSAANEARVRILAAAAARDEAKLARSLRVVRAALDQGLITLDDVTDDDAPLEVSA